MPSYGDDQIGKWFPIRHFIVVSGLSLQAKVSDVITHGTWVWPAELIAKYPTLDNYIVPINNDLDRLFWIDCHGNSKKRKLKTQDLIPAWDVSLDLGGLIRFFFAGLDNSQPNIYSIINALLPIVKRRTTNCVIAKLVVAASAYFVWQERNWRLFQKGKRTIDQVVDCIKSVVRLKLLSCKMRKSKSGERLARLWDLPEAIFV
ncbi:hypothetical protein Tco_0566855 [Tanacetum coccineum]